METSTPSVDVRYDVFVSYKRENISFVSKVINELSNDAHDVKAWVDLEKLHKSPSKEYEALIHKAIDNSKLFLLIYTKDVEESDFIIEQELAYAIKKEKPVFVFPQEPISKESRIYKDVSKLQWLDTKESVAFQSDIQDALHDSQRFEELSRLTGHGFTVYDDQNVFLIRIALQRELGKITPFGNYTKLAGSDNYYRSGLAELEVLPKSFFLDIPSEYKSQLIEKRFIRTEKNADIERLINDLDVDNCEIYERLLSFINSNKQYNTSILHERLEKYLSMEKDLYSSIVLPSEEELSADEFVRIVTMMSACSILRDLSLEKTLFNGAELGVEGVVDGRTGDDERHWVKLKLFYSDYFTFKTMTLMYHILSSISDEPFAPVKKEGRRLETYSPFLCSLGLGGFVVAYQDNTPYLMWTKRSEKISSGDMWHFSFDETVSLLKDSIKSNGNIVINPDRGVSIIPETIIKRAIVEEIGIPEGLVEDVHSGLFEVGLIQSERLEIELIANVTIHLDSDKSLKATFKKWHDASSDGYLEISKIDFIPIKEIAELVGRLLSPEALSIRDRLAERVRDSIGRNTIIGDGTVVEYGSYIDDGAVIGKDCKIHRNVYVGKGVRIGDKCKIQNNNSIYPGVVLEEGVFVGTNVCFTNDLYPRAIKLDGALMTGGDWELLPTIVKKGASIGAGAVIRCGVTIGEWAMVGCGAVVVDSVPAGKTVVGNPARVIESKEIIK